MSSIEIVPFSEDHIEAAAALVAARYRAERDFNKSLPTKYEEAEAIVPILQDNSKRTTGVTTIREGRLAGFATGLMTMHREARTAYIPDWGHGTEPADRWGTYRAMYAGLAHHWVANGYFTHIVTVFANEREVADAWFSLGFGLENVDALREVSLVEGPVAEVEIRRANPEDFDVVMALTLATRQHIATTPAFRPLLDHEGAEYYKQQLSDLDVVWWLAYQDGEVVGGMRIVPSSKRNFVMTVADESTCAITMAFTMEKERNHGIGTTLLKHSLEWVRSVGYKKCAVDFESANIPGSRFWLANFQPVCYSLVRRLDGRIAWAHENRDEVDFRR